MKEFVSVILPCRNEERTIAECIRKIRQVFSKNKLSGEIIVSDSSSDGSGDIADKLGVKVIKHNREGYGFAYHAGIKHAKGNIIIMGDADNTYDFSEIPKLLLKAKDNDLVIGSRLKGKIMKGAMPWLHKFVGNPALSFLLRFFFRVKVSDTQSGFRLIKRSAWDRLNLKTTGMEFASEMLIKASKLKFRIDEVPITYYPRAEGSESKLRSFRDGWKHLRFMIMFGSIMFFLFFSVVFLLTGIALFLIKNMFYNMFGIIFIMIGYQIILIGIFAKNYAASHLVKIDKTADLINKYLSIEKGILFGLIFIFIGVSGFIVTKLLIFVALMCIGIQSVFFAIIISIIGIQDKNM